MLVGSVGVGYGVLGVGAPGVPSSCAGANGSSVSVTTSPISQGGSGTGCGSLGEGGSLSGVLGGMEDGIGVAGAGGATPVPSGGGEAATVL